MCPQLAYRLTQTTFSSSLALHPKGVPRVLAYSRRGLWSGNWVLSRQWWLRSSRRYQALAPVLSRAPLQQVRQHIFATYSFAVGREFQNFLSAGRHLCCTDDAWDDTSWVLCQCPKCFPLLISSSSGGQLRGCFQLHFVRRAFQHICLASACQAVVSRRQLHIQACTEKQQMDPVLKTLMSLQGVLTSLRCNLRDTCHQLLLPPDCPSPPTQRRPSLTEVFLLRQAHACIVQHQSAASPVTMQSGLCLDVPIVYWLCFMQ